MSKFLNYVKKFLALSFISATAAFLISYNSNIQGTVQKVDTTNISNSLTTNETTAVDDSKAVEKREDKKKVVYKTNKDTKNSVLYVETKPSSVDQDNKFVAGECTAVIMSDDATLYGSLGSPTVNGDSKLNVKEAYFAGNIKSLTIDSCSTNTNISTDKLEKFKVLHLTAKEYSDVKSEKIKSLGKDVYDKSTETWLSSKESVSPLRSVSPLQKDKRCNLYVSSKDTWKDLINANFEESAVNTGTINFGNAVVDPQMADEFSEQVNIKEPTTVTLSYTPNSEINTYYSEFKNPEVDLYPLSQFSQHVLELCKDKIVADGAENGYAEQWKAILDQCITEYSKLSDTAKNTKEVIFNMDEDYTTAYDKESNTTTPKDVLETYLRAYLLTAAVRDLCEHKNDENPSKLCTEKEILESIDKKKLSSEDEQYLINMISANYDRLDDEFGDKFSDIKDIKTFAKSSKNDLIKEISEIPADDSADSSSGKKDSSGSSSSGSSGSSSGGSSSGSSGTSYGSSSSNKSASIRTGSESLLMLVSSFGLSSGALLSLRKRK